MLGSCHRPTRGVARFEVIGEQRHFDPAAGEILVDEIGAIGFPNDEGAVQMVADRDSGAREPEIARFLDLERTLAARTFWEFDDAATAPLHGFAGADDYYRRSSSATFIPAISVPTLIIHSRDDPFLPAGAIPESAMESNPAVTPLISNRGDHVCFVTGGVPFAPLFWAEDRITRWLAERIT